MNRIVQCNGAAPPWVEVQGELESTVVAFREILRQSWMRRGLRMLTLHQSPDLYTLSLADVTSLRDPEWEARERSYHDQALKEINSLVRKYNTLAPYVVRRPYYVRSTELEKAYADAGLDIIRAIEESRGAKQGGIGKGNSEQQAVREMDAGPPLRIRDVIRGWLSKLLRGR